MQFRVTTRKELTLNPSLLSDPAFSPDPNSNPYSASNGEPAWASSPPLGHPVLKRRNPRQTSIFAHPISADDFDFQLIQPPNSPDIPPSATQTASSFPFLHDTPSLSTQAAPEVLKPPATFPSITNSQPSPPQPQQQPKEEKKKKRRMPFLSRRKSSQPPASVPSPPKVPIIQAQTQAAVRNDVTQRPPFPGQNVSEPVSQNGSSRPAMLSRSATSGASTPTARSVITTRSNVPSQNASVRPQDLDRIDELDETNPWGISLHHRGPYEAAVQALRNPMSLGQGSSMLNDYPRQAHHAQENVYIPPQVPMGVSLNLSPGQILPRNFGMPPNRYPRRQATIDSPPQRMPASFVASTPALRRQSQPVQPMSHYPNPYPIMPVISHDPPPPVPIVTQPPPPSRAHRQPEILSPEVKADKSDVLPFDIGMAMLQPEPSESSNPSIYLQPETIHGSEFDPYDPIHLENAHSRTPSPLVHEPSPERSREPTPDPTPERLIPQPTIFRKSPEHPDSLRPGSNKQVSNNTPTRMDTISVPTKQRPSAQTQDQFQNQPRTHSPLPPPSLGSHVNMGRNDSTPSLVLNTSAAEVKSSVNNATPPGLSKEERSGPQIPVTLNIRDQINIGPPAVQDHDTRSTNQSISTYTSSQVRSGKPPPHRRVPKHLVMPTPLNPANNLNAARLQQTQMQQTLPPSQFGPTKVQVQIRAQSHVPYPPVPQMLGPFAPNLVSQEKQTASGGKLRKKLSTKFIPPKVANIPSAPVVANVSFAPPVIGYGPPPSMDKDLGSNTKISKRLLSKRRTDF